MSSVKDEGINTKKNSARNQYKKPYSAPRLMEYGPVEKLTQAGSGEGQEAGTARRRQ